MSELYRIENETLTSMADKIRILSGTEGTMTTAQMDSKLGEANTEVANQTDLIAQIVDALEDKAAGGSAQPNLQEKTVTPTTSAQTVAPDTGYDGLSSVKVNAMPTATQATPSITVSSSGLITASATQSAGYVASGTKSATKQLTTQAAKTITPSTSSQTAVAKDRYTTGAVTVAGDTNLIAANIAEGVSIFGITGTHSGSSSDNFTNVTVNFNWSATSISYAPEVFYTKATDNNDDMHGQVYTASSISGSTTLTVTKNSVICIVCKGTTANNYGVVSHSVSDGIKSIYNVSIASARYANALFFVSNDGNLTVNMGTRNTGGSID